MSSALLNPERALIFRITHIDNVPWVLDHGLHCRNSAVRDPHFREIGNPDLIVKRIHHPVPAGPRGTLSDYVPFYFTPWSPMLLNIVTGYGGVPQTLARDIAILVSSIHRLDELGLAYVLSDRHAYLAAARFATDATGLERVDWPLLQARDFRRDNNDLGKLERYQAEALIHRHVPIDALLGLGVNGPQQEARLAQELHRRGSSLKLAVRPDWYP